MANKKISELTELMTTADDDLLVIVDDTDNTTKKIKVSNFGGGTPVIDTIKTTTQFTHNLATTDPVQVGSLTIPADTVKEGDIWQVKYLILKDENITTGGTSAFLNGLNIVDGDANSLQLFSGGDASQVVNKHILFKNGFATVINGVDNYNGYENLSDQTLNENSSITNIPFDYSIPNTINIFAKKGSAVIDPMTFYWGMLTKLNGNDSKLIVGGGNINSVTGNIVGGTATDPIITQVQTDWNASSGVGELLNKPFLQIVDNVRVSTTSTALVIVKEWEIGLLNQYKKINFTIASNRVGTGNATVRFSLRDVLGVSAEIQLISSSYNNGICVYVREGTTINTADNTIKQAASNISSDIGINAAFGSPAFDPAVNYKLVLSISAAAGVETFINSVEINLPK